MDTTAPRSHTWRFFRTCGLDQALLQSGGDLADRPALLFLDREVAQAGSALTLVENLDEQGLLSVENHLGVAYVIDYLLDNEATVVQANYVQTFDLTPEHSLHLTHHIFGEEKTRGPALIDLTEYLKSYGYQHDEKELPDFLPLMLEFVSELAVDEARVFLGDASKVLGVIADNLDKAASPYARLIGVVNQFGSLVKLAA